MITLDRPVEVPEFMPDWAPFEGEDVWCGVADGKKIRDAERAEVGDDGKD